MASVMSLSSLCRGACRSVRKSVMPVRAVAIAPFRSFSDVTYSKSHEWFKVEGNTGTLGISEYAQGQLGEVVYCDLPSEGASFTAKDTICTLESVKAVGEVYAPCDCEVVEVNETLADEPATVNSSPEADGWLVKVKFETAPSDFMDSDAYKKHIEAEIAEAE